MCLVVKVYIFHKTGKDIRVAPRHNEIALLLKAFKVAEKWLKENAVRL